MYGNKLIRVGTLIVAGSVLSMAQSVVERSASGRLIPGCHRVWLTSQNAALPTVLISDKLRARGEFTDAGLVLSTSKDEADLAVTVTGDWHDAIVFVTREADGTTASSKGCSSG